ncbi:hypothetical protein [Flavobacterium sp.]|uniref:hypothetical protein n=1 Tax=Flavobacterium sp. TaxID=239 RepID=UPI00260AED31|nr:hypothetical protein [Flavobacterium sp.]
MNEPLDALYYEWLYEQVGRQGNVKSRTHRKLLKHLYSKAFVWLIPNDDNRVEDGRELRYEFAQAAHLQSLDAEWLGLECSVLEMLIGLSRRLSFVAEGEPRDWFWHLMRNLGLDGFSDNQYDGYIIEIEEVLNQLVFRTYLSNGQGGLFPLSYPQEDQRGVELWYQMSEYLAELEA